MKPLRISHDQPRMNTFAINTSDTLYTGVLSSTNQSVSIPSGANRVIFSANGDFYVSFDGDPAVVPTGDIAVDNVELNPAVRDVSDLAAASTALNLIAPATTKITLAFYS